MRKAIKSDDGLVRASDTPHHSSFIIHHSILSDLSEVDAVCHAARNLLAQVGQTGHTFAVDLLLREFLNNAILHGHLSDHRKRVHVAVRIDRKWIALRIADEGPGFDWQAAKRSIPDENTTSGRGLAIGARYAQRMQFNRAGNVVALWVRKTVDVHGI